MLMRRRFLPMSLLLFQLQWFHPYEMRIYKAKSKLKNSLQVEVSWRTFGKADVIIIDGSALLWITHWPADRTVEDFLENVKSRLSNPTWPTVMSTSSLIGTMSTALSLPHEMAERQASAENTNSIGLQSYQLTRSSCLLLKTRSKSSISYWMNSSETSFSIRRVYKGTSWLWLPYWSQHEKKHKPVWSGDPTWRDQHHHYPLSPALCWTGRPNRCDVGWYRRFCSATTSLL